MKINQKVKPLVFTDEGRQITVQYENRGEPFREGVGITFDSELPSEHAVWVLLDVQEVAQLRDKLNAFLGHSQKATGRKDLVGLLPVVYNGKSAEEWCQLHAQAVLSLAKLVVPWEDIGSAPRDGREVLVWYDVWPSRVYVAYFAHSTWQTGCLETGRHTPTRWRPLPPSPTTDGE